MTILYTVVKGAYYNLKELTQEERLTFPKNIYVNLTNRCPCACTFCLRQTKEMEESNTLWLKEEPPVSSVIDEFEEEDLTSCEEVIFCGFGEPTMRIDAILEIAAYLKKRIPSLKIRINTNGLADLVHQKPIAPLFEGLIDTVSISLNASTAEEYYNLTRNKFGMESFEAMKKFAVSCKSFVPNVVLTVVDCIGTEEINACREVCKKLDIPLRVRTFE